MLYRLYAVAYRKHDCIRCIRCIRCIPLQGVRDSACPLYRLYPAIAVENAVANALPLDSSVATSWRHARGGRPCRHAVAPSADHHSASARDTRFRD